MPGNWYWTVQGLDSGSPVGDPSEPWKLIAPTIAHANASWGSMADYNGDGRADFALIESPIPRLLVYYGTNSGPVDAPQVLGVPFDAGEFGASMADVGDVNGDGFGDLLVGAPASSSVYLYFGGASGLTPAPQTVTGPAGTRFGSRVVRVDDFNRDGYADAIVEGNEPFFLRGSSTGLAIATHQRIIGSRFVGAGDITGDGLSDVIETGSTQSTLIYGNSAAFRASFAALSEVVVPVGDLNGDGRADLSSSSGFWLGNASSLSPTRPGFSAIFSGDFDGDGRSDVGNRRGCILEESAGASPGDAPVYCSTAALEFASSSATAVADADRDGFDDLLAFTTTPGAPRTARIVRGSATGAIAGAVAFDPVQPGTRHPLGDIDGDLHGDTAIVNPVAGAAPTLSIARGSSTGFAPTTVTLPFNAAVVVSSVASAGDVNGDGRRDVVAAAQNRVYVWLNEGTSFGVAPIVVPHGSAWFTSALGVGDIDHDGFSDIIAQDYGFDATLFRGGATGPSTAPVSLGGLGGRVVAAGDLDGDSFADIVVSVASPRQLRVYRGSPSGLTAPVILPGIAQGWLLGAAVGDVDGDGLKDIVDVGRREIAVYRNTGSGFTAMPSYVPSDISIYYDADRVFIGDTNADGIDDLAVYDAARGFVFLGSASGLQPPTSSPLPTRGGIAGGDIDGDGRIEFFSPTDNRFLSFSPTAAVWTVSLRSP